MAELHLGELDLRERQVRRAYERLKDDAEPRLADLLETLPAGVDDGGIFRPVPAVPVRAYYADALFETRRLVWLVETNNALTDPNAAEALGALLSLNPLA
ncbi:MAG: hypothetical protein ACLFV7_11640, partial [Phycisphaerae bacterium]